MERFDSFLKDLKSILADALSLLTGHDIWVLVALAVICGLLHTPLVWHAWKHRDHKGNLVFQLLWIFVMMFVTVALVAAVWTVVVTPDMQSFAFLRPLSGVIAAVAIIYIIAVVGLMITRNYEDGIPEYKDVEVLKALDAQADTDTSDNTTRMPETRRQDPYPDYP